MPRFVILYHDHPQPHWDLLLEHGDSCLTWRLDRELVLNCELQLQAADNHRLMYLDYEGPVSGGRGEVTRWDSGRFFWLTMTDQRIEVRLEGTKCFGQLIIQQTSGQTTGTLRPTTPDPTMKPRMTKLVFRLPGHYDGDLDPSTRSNSPRDES